MLRLCFCILLLVVVLGDCLFLLVYGVFAGCLFWIVCFLVLDVLIVFVLLFRFVYCGLIFWIVLCTLLCWLFVGWV